MIFRYGLILLLLGFILSCSENATVAGGSVGSGNAEITGAIHHPDEEPPGNTLVYLIREGYNPVSPFNRPSDLLSTETNEEGEFTFEEVPEGTYNFQVPNPSNGTGLLVNNINISKNDTLFESLEMQKTGRISVHVDALPGTEKGHLYIPGTLIKSQIDPADISDSYFIMESVPPGSDFIVNFQNHENSLNLELAQSVEVVSDETVFLPLEHTIITRDTVSATGNTFFTIVDTTLISQDTSLVTSDTMRVTSDTLNITTYTLTVSTDTATSTSDSMVVTIDTMLVASDTGVITGLANWKYTTTITVDKAAAGVEMSTEDRKYFPLLIRLNENNFNFEEAMSRGEDIRFTKLDGSQYYHEIEEWDAAIGKAELWVLTDTIYRDRDSIQFTMYWGNPLAVERSNPGIVFNLSHNFLNVYHMNENPAGDLQGAIKDRSAIWHHASPTGGMTSANSVPGMIGSAILFDGIDDGLLPTSDQVLFPEPYSKLGFSCWIKLGTGMENNAIIYEQGGETSGLAVGYSPDSSRFFFGKRSSNDTDSTVVAWSTTQFPQGHADFIHLAATFNSEGVKLYINSVEEGKVNMADTVSGADGEAGIGIVNGTSIVTGPTSPFSGIIDEIQISNTVRISDFLKLSYESQRPDQVMVIVGTKEK